MKDKMAIISYRETKCELCDQIIFEDQKIVAFPDFLPSDHKYGKFSNAVIHDACFLNYPDSEKINNLVAAWTLIWNSRPKEVNSSKDFNVWEKEAFKDWPPKGDIIVF